MPGAQHPQHPALGLAAPRRASRAARRRLPTAAGGRPHGTQPGHQLRRRAPSRAGGRAGAGLGARRRAAARGRGLAAGDAASGAGDAVPHRGHGPALPGGAPHGPSPVHVVAGPGRTARAAGGGGPRPGRRRRRPARRHRAVRRRAADQPRPRRPGTRPEPAPGGCRLARPRAPRGPRLPAAPRRGRPWLQVPRGCPGGLRRGRRRHGWADRAGRGSRRPRRVAAHRGGAERLVAGRHPRRPVRGAPQPGGRGRRDQSGAAARGAPHRSRPAPAGAGRLAAPQPQRRSRTPRAEAVAEVLG